MAHEMRIHVCPAKLEFDELGFSFHLRRQACVLSGDHGTRLLQFQNEVAALRRVVWGDQHPQWRLE